MIPPQLGMVKLAGEMIDGGRVNHGVIVDRQASRNTLLQKMYGGMKPPAVVETVVSSGQSQTSSIGIGEFGMNTAHRGNAATFSMAVKDNLFPKLKFLQGTNASLEFSMDNTTSTLTSATTKSKWLSSSSMVSSYHSQLYYRRHLLPQPLLTLLFLTTSLDSGRCHSSFGHHARITSA